MWLCRVQQSILEPGSTSGLLSTLRKTITRASSVPVSRILQINVNDDTLKSLAEESVKESHKVIGSPVTEDQLNHLLGVSHLLGARFEQPYIIKWMPFQQRFVGDLSESACHLQLRWPKVLKVFMKRWYGIIDKGFAGNEAEW